MITIIITVPPHFNWLVFPKLLIPRKQVVHFPLSQLNLDAEFSLTLKKVHVNIDQLSENGQRILFATDK